jgi:hypothetical protein
VSIDDRETAIQRHNEVMLKDTSERPPIFYTDGSGYEGTIASSTGSCLKTQPLHEHCLINLYMDVRVEHNCEERHINLFIISRSRDRNVVGVVANAFVQ